MFGMWCMFGFTSLRQIREQVRHCQACNTRIRKVEASKHSGNLPLKRLEKAPYS